jgi:peptidyl-prolyl cis-trans isomerase C
MKDRMPERVGLVCLRAALLVFLSSAAAFAEAPAPTAAAEPVLVRIDGLAVTLAEFEALYKLLSPESRAHYEAPGAGGKRGFLQDFVRKKLLALQAEKSGVAEDLEVRLSLMVARDTILYDGYVRRLVEKRLGEERLRGYYAAHRNDFSVPLRMHVRHILVTPRPTQPIPNLDQDDAADEAAAQKKLERIRQKLAAGEAFGRVAQQLSEDRSAGSGGDLGFVERGKLLPALDQAAFSLKKGQTSEVVREEDGYHLLYVEEREEAGVLPFEEVREEILDILSLDVGQSVDEELEATAEELRRSMNVRIDESLLDPGPLRSD